ncbi:MAG: hypothetical protein ACKVX7_06415 [Planctomycetota bacterium]
MTKKYVWLPCALGALALLLTSCEKRVEAPGPTDRETAPTAAKAPAGPATTPSAPVDGAVTLSAPATVVAGGLLLAKWTGPGNAADYIDIVPRGDTKTSGELTYSYVKDSKGDGLSVRVPTQPGDYDLRYVLDLGTTRVVKATQAITVTPAIATLTAPAEALGGAEIKVMWTGPNGSGDYIDLVSAGATATRGEITYAITSAGMPAVMRVPGAAGSYEFRYVLEGTGGRQVIARTALKVTTPTATLAAPQTVGNGGDVQVTWTGPGNSDDYIDLVPKGHAPTSGELTYFYTRVGPTGKLTAPAKPGDYEIRYVLDAPGGRLVLARAPLTVN